MRTKIRTATIALVLLVGFAADPATAQEIDAQVADLEVVGWTVDDSPDGNGDGGLHPGETAFVQVWLSNRGSATARNVSGVISEVVDHADVEILDKGALWPDLPATGAPGVSLSPHFRIRVDDTRPCGWEIPLRLELTASDGYLETRELTLVMVDRRETDLIENQARPFYYGRDAGDEIGWASLATGDINDDGFDDLVVGVELGDGPSNGRANAGEAIVIYGGPSPPSDTDLATIPAGVSYVYGVDPSDGLGNSVATGDVNGDGFDDLILAAPGAAGPSNARGGAGEVYVVYGQATQLPDVDLAAPPVAATVIWGADLGDGLGDDVAAGDLDGDGLDDLILGASRADGPSNTRFNAGAAIVLYGQSGTLPDVDLANTTMNVTIAHGADDDDGLGEFVAVGDLDGDGFAEMLAAARIADGPGNGRSDAGEVAVVYGGPGPLADVDLSAPSPNVARIYGADAIDHLARTLISADVDGDGFDDVVIGTDDADGADNGGTFTGEFRVIYGGATRLQDIDLLGNPAGVDTIWGADAEDGLGRGGAVGDVDGDGRADLILGGYKGDGPGGLRTEAGDVPVIFGSGARVGNIDLSSPPSNVEFVYGRDPLDWLGHRAATGDFDGDGFDDVFLAAPNGDGPDGSRADAGEIAVVPGRPRGRWRHDPDTFSFIDATVGTDTGLACDDCSATIPIGFDFVFGGRSYDQVTVSSNGYLTFEGPGNLPGGFCPPASNPPDAVIAPFWDDLDPSAGGAIYYLLEGSAPSRRLTVEWSAVPLWPATDAATFEVTLFESSNQILFQYQDVVFGNASDNGGTAVVGVEEAGGRNGTARSCFTPDLGNGEAIRWRRFASPTIVFRDDVDPPGGWTFSGLWEVVTDPACAPSSRSGTSAFYYGQQGGGTCNIANDMVHSGTLTSDVIPALAQDAALTFWQRRDGGQVGSPDVSAVRVDDGTTVTEIRRVDEASNQWLYSSDILGDDPENGVFAPLDLSAFVGQDVRLDFLYDTVDIASEPVLGWMIDDVTVRGCPVFSTGGTDGAATEARATAQPQTYCEGQSGGLDALGSWCSACTALTYQWKKNGQPIGGATLVGYTIPASEPPGLYDYSVEIDCATATTCLEESPVTQVDIVQKPLEVGPTLTVDRVNGGADLELHWGDVAGADDYVVLSDTDPAGGFGVQEGSSPDGSTGLTIPLPGETRFYLVAGRNPVCGLGPK